ncbi:MAG: AMP-dependent synthetase [Hamadaea sp.]|uniref:TIGR03089 family protein n=1 Tax=Hamadaea sp. TaxID=2024425 RepID=UPI001843DA99|nr:TIGR03089 family protein [Hamadaea sp.]NUR71238.1 AMP-dependent synthetase [Hamadaea sp.]NUT19639.1 AMP-dependent synthetase [Hamadaea sp.]
MYDVLTYYDDKSGERVALSAADLGVWAGRTADLLTGECRLRRGDRAGVLLPPHWLTAAVLLGAWSIGISVDYRGYATAGLGEPGGPYDVVFASPDRVRSMLEDVPPANWQFAVGGPVPEGYLDFEAMVEQRDAVTPPYEEVLGSDPASVDGTTYGAWEQLARELAAQMGIQAGDRVLIDANEHDHPVKWLLAPMTVGASVVLCANLDPALVESRVEEEGVTRVL